MYTDKQRQTNKDRRQTTTDKQRQTNKGRRTFHCGSFQTWRTFCCYSRTLDHDLFIHLNFNWMKSGIIFINVTEVFSLNSFIYSDKHCWLLSESHKMYGAPYFLKKKWQVYNFFCLISNMFYYILYLFTLSWGVKFSPRVQTWPKVLKIMNCSVFFLLNIKNVIFIWYYINNKLGVKLDPRKRFWPQLDFYPRFKTLII